MPRGFHLFIYFICAIFASKIRIKQINVWGKITEIAVWKKLIVHKKNRFKNMI